MALFTLKKTMLHLALSIALCLAVWLFSGGGAVYAAFMAGFLGAAYLLAAWLTFLKTKGKDFFAMLKRKKEPEVPYFHRKDKGSASRLRFFRERHDYDDDGDPAVPLDKLLRERCAALAFLICGTVMLIASLLPV